MKTEAPRFYITTPIYYVNARPHLGTAYTGVIADILNRYRKLFGEETFFQTGLDERGQKCQRAAEAQGKTPQEHCDEMSRIHQKVWDRLNVRYDLFFRTSHKYKDPAKTNHTKALQNGLRKLQEKGDVYEDVYEGLYSVSEEMFYSEKDLKDGKSPAGKEVVPIKEKNYFFKMSRYQERLIKHLEENPGFVRPAARQNELKGFLRKPLQDLCISRPKKRVSWGAELPFDSDYTIYVWVDALFNYITGAGYGSDEAEDARFFQKWQENTGACHLIGKDILITHGVYWPCLLMALDLPLPKLIFAHGWLLTKNTGKMSKSGGDVLDPLRLTEKFGSEPLRYFLAREIDLGHDAEVSLDGMRQRINQDLSNSIGNILSRLIRLTELRFQGCIPSPPESGSAGAKESGPEDVGPEESGPAAARAARSEGTAAPATRENEDDFPNRLVCKTQALCRNFKGRIKNFQLSGVLGDIQDILRDVNVYLEKTAPWKKTVSQKEAAEILYVSLETVRICGILLFPVTPNKMRRLLQTLNAPLPVSAAPPPLQEAAETGCGPTGSLESVSKQEAQSLPQSKNRLPLTQAPLTQAPETPEPPPQAPLSFEESVRWGGLKAGAKLQPGPPLFPKV